MRLRLLFEWCLVALLTGAIVAGLLIGKGTERLDNVLYDSLVGLSAPPASERILLVTIDDPSIAALGKWPWPRETHARFLERLSGAGVAAVAYDVLFTETGDAAQDERLARALAATRNVSLPVLFETPGSNGRSIDVTPPLPDFAQSAHSLGQVALFPDNEGVARSVPLSLVVDGHAWLHLMETTYRTAQGHPSPVFERLQGSDNAFVTVPFRPRSGDFRTVSFASVLAGEVPAQFLKGRIVLVGVTGTGLGDRFRVPSRTGGMISGIELQANVLNSLLANRMVIVPAQGWRLAISLLPALILLVSFWRLRPSRAFAASLAAIALVLVAPVLLLALGDIWLAPTPALVGLLVAYPLWGWRRLHAVDMQLAEELDRFDAEGTPVRSGPEVRAYLDPVGGQAARLRAAIAEMRDLRQLVGDTIDSVNDPIVVTDLGDRPILENAAARALLAAGAGAGAGDGGGEGMAPWLAGTAPVDGDEEGSFRIHEGRAYSLRRFPLRDHAGRERGSIMHFVDVTTIRDAQRAREVALEFLSHDMRSPQSSIIALVESHRSAIGDKLLAERIAALARKTLRLADDFVHLARISAAPFAPEDVDLADIMVEAADDIWAMASRGGVAIVVDGEEAAFVAGERDTLVRAFVNLIENAVKFSPAGATVHCTVLGLPGGGFECRVDDEGPGIPDARRANLFASFGFSGGQAGKSLSSGLGLAFVGAAMARHGAAIAFEDRASGGTRFVIRFSALEPLLS